ncbi:hypothetical protein GCM10025867_32360 [Frondihabitans sucicola]|uniref:Uridine kinase n=1 Tax=Frondihabitans sucicola TaxID=1268041 RepID=A0ABM8GRD4_9MICO|nr:hypothetical protein [Frondihabitans sucicola]BDZ50995.1 hypothetical protein GCM10025867_32360 [Frondihabitans sucicola]
MTRWAPEKKDTVRALAVEILHNYGHGRAFIAVDGPDARADAVFADDLVVALKEQGHAAFRASVGDFLLPRAQRAIAGENAIDELTFRRVLIEPFRMGGSTGWVPAAFDARADRPFESTWVTGPADALLIVDGALIGRAELAGLWNYAIWVEGGDTADRSPEARGRSAAVIDNTDPDHPRRLFDDAC